MEKLKHALPRLLCLLAALALAPACILPACSQAAEADPAFPSRPLHFIVPYPPGGGNDLFARVVGQRIAENTGQAVIVENRPGAAGLIAGDYVARSAPDGYTFMVDQSSIATNPLIYKKTAFDVRHDLAPVIRAATLDNVILVSTASSIHSVKDLIEQARRQPGKLTYGSVGIGSSQHLAMELLSHQAGIKLLHVPYKGTAAAVTAVSSGEIQVFLISAATGQSYVKSGKVRAIATTGSKRSPIMPDVPTVKESGLPDYVNYNWLGIFAPAATPQPVVDRLNVLFAKAMADRKVKNTLDVQGWQLVGGTPQALRDTVDGEMRRYEQIVREQNIQIDQ
ncbi:Bug family tripartite tricarboxylate transporter substrate binding protein [Achromobacter aloeverae]